MGKSRHGDMASVTNLIKDAENKGLISYNRTSKGYMLKSKKDSSQELIHKGERALHYARRYIDKQEKIL
jgi:hypothetical protein